MFTALLMTSTVPVDQYVDILYGELVCLFDPIGCLRANLHTQGRQDEHPSLVLPDWIRKARTTVDRAVKSYIGNGRPYDSLQRRCISRTSTNPPFHEIPND
jgi:hypothetical protein